MNPSIWGIKGFKESAARDPLGELGRTFKNLMGRF